MLLCKLAFFSFENTDKLAHAEYTNELSNAFSLPYLHMPSLEAFFYMVY